MKLSEHFNDEEFVCKCGCGRKDINPMLLIKLEEIREYTKRAVFITSGVRCPLYNRQINGAHNSPHMFGHAVDISVSNSKDRYELVMAAMTKGIRRIGVGKNFVHVDVAPEGRWAQDVIWTYY